MKNLDITEVGRRSGLPASTLRYYEEKGLITSVGRRGLHRLFAPEVLDRLALIALGRVAGFSLDEIALMFSPDGRPRIDRKLLAAKADDLDNTIRELTAMRNGLAMPRHAPRPRTWNAPPFAATSARQRPERSARRRDKCPKALGAARRAAIKAGISRMSTVPPRRPSGCQRRFRSHRVGPLRGMKLHSYSWAGAHGRNRARATDPTFRA